MDGLLFRRQMMGRSSTPPTPVPYDAMVAYLEASGTQWIDTQFVPSVGDSIELEVYPISLSINPNAQTFVSAGDGTNIINIRWIRSNNALSFTFFSSQTMGGLSFNGNMWHKIEVDANGVLLIDGSQAATMSPIGLDGTNKVLRLFLKADNTFPLYGRIRTFKLWSLGVLHFDLIPVRIGQVGYMYDRVSGQLFGNAGTGDFILGPDV